jgi:hypothetical protein
VRFALDGVGAATLADLVQSSGDLARSTTQLWRRCGGRVRCRRAARLFGADPLRAAAIPRRYAASPIRWTILPSERKSRPRRLASGAMTLQTANQATRMYGNERGPEEIGENPARSWPTSHRQYRLLGVSPIACFTKLSVIGF